MSARYALPWLAALCAVGCATVENDPLVAASERGVVVAEPVIKLDGTAEQALMQRNNEKAVALALDALRAAERGELVLAAASLQSAAGESVQLAPLLEQVQRLLSQLADARASASALSVSHAQEILVLREEIEKRDQAIKRLRDLTLQQ